MRELRLLEFDDKFVGVRLPWQGKAQQEWGIEELVNFFGVKDGLEPIQKIPSFLEFGYAKDKDNQIALKCSQSFVPKTTDFISLPIECNDSFGIGKDKEFLYTWSNEFFCILGKTKESHYLLKELYEHFNKKEVSFGYFGYRNPKTGYVTHKDLFIFINPNLPNENELEQFLEDELKPKQIR